ncbi:unnamed protein product [Phytophthora fragariaefolia]|uniref:Unnamed protein product n=1 Tax=Phytophthora fragariaefolia TaxID=1490495 RepID=A0A9W6X2A9_9STRA|nr:unnamed protein product [Phytophthora fragariaefolia]
MQTKDEHVVDKWRHTLSQHVLHEFGSLRITQLFEIIKEFPDRYSMMEAATWMRMEAELTRAGSIPALEDLRLCLERTHQHDELLREFQGTLQSRLLQPGANTSAILDIYVSTIKVHCSTMLERCNSKLNPMLLCVAAYLRKRKDTVRCIVQSLTDEQSGDLFEELRRDNMRIIQHDDDSDDDEVLNNPHHHLGMNGGLTDATPLHQ